LKVKLGQQIKLNNAHTISLAKGGTAEVKPGDIATVVKKIDEETGEIVYITGEAKGLNEKISIEIDDDIDTDSLVKKIINELNK
jgi:hypothetical protein